MRLNADAATNEPVKKHRNNTTDHNSQQDGGIDQPAPAQPMPALQRAAQPGQPQWRHQDVLQLQRQLGNRATTQLIQRQQSLSSNVVQRANGDGQKVSRVVRFGRYLRNLFSSNNNDNDNDNNSVQDDDDQWDEQNFNPLNQDRNPLFGQQQPQQQLVIGRGNDGVGGNVPNDLVQTPGGDHDDLYAPPDKDVDEINLMDLKNEFDKMFEEIQTSGPQGEPDHIGEPDHDLDDQNEGEPGMPPQGESGQDPDVDEINLMDLKEDLDEMFSGKTPGGPTPGQTTGGPRLLI